MKSIDLQDSAIVVTTFLRPAALLAFLESVRTFYPALQVIVVADSDTPDDVVRQVTGRLGAICVQTLVEDSGVGAKRNFGLGAAKVLGKKVAFICEDDFLFTEETVLEALLDVMSADCSIGVVAGALKYDDETTRRDFVCGIEFKREEKALYIKNKKWVPTHEAPGGTPYMLADYVFNFCAVRITPTIYWDVRLKTSVEHLDFAWRMKDEGLWKTAFTATCVARHVQVEESEEYQALRRRRDSWPIFFRKTGIKYTLNFTEFHVADYETGQLLPYPEFGYRFILETKRAGVLTEAGFGSASSSGPLKGRST